VKIRNKDNGVVAEVPDSLADLLLKAGGWVADDGVEAPVVKAVRKRAPKKAVAEDEG